MNAISSHSYSVSGHHGATLSRRNTSASANRTTVGNQSGGYISSASRGNTSSGAYSRPAGATLRSNSTQRISTGSSLSNGAGGTLSSASRSTSSTYTSTTRISSGGSTGSRCIPCGG